MEQALATPATAARARGHDGLRLAACLAALVSLGAVGTALHPRLSLPAAEAAANGAGWEGRRLIAQLLWAKTHAVMHAGVEERAARPGEAHDHGHKSGEGEAGHVYVIPPERQDFRGLLGHLERNVKPYLAPNGKPYSKADDQTVPFYRLMTWADPHFVQGYTVGAFYLADQGRGADRALEFLHEGERNNPASFEIQVELGHAYLMLKKEPRRAVPHLERALRLIPTRALTEPEIDSRLNGYRWLAYSYVRSGRRADALRLSYQGLLLSPGDATFTTVIKHRGRDWMAAS